MITCYTILFFNELVILNYIKILYYPFNIYEAPQVVNCIINYLYSL